jgi:crotonobetainyl-CoA:carnitine CoA-transferase CaiB-like acyl-CoA transferase
LISRKEGKEVLYRLVKESDVFYTNYSNRVLTKLGVDYDTLCRYNPKLVYGIATGYGTAGPEAGRRAFDIIAQAQSGMMTIGGEDGTPPSQIVGGIVDQTGATMLAYGILAALSLPRTNGNRTTR